MSTEPLLRTEGLKKHFSTANGMLDRLLGDDRTVRAVDGVDMELRPGETVGLVGESGCGKSTLGRALLQLDEPTAGDAYFRGENLTEFDGDRLREFRRHAQMVFQDPQSSLNPRKTVGQIVSTPMQIQGVYKGERQERVAQLLEDVGLSQRHANNYIHQMSGGQRQRVGIARALSVDPEFIVCDEPVSALDVSVQAQILNLLEEIQEKYELTLLFISHDLSVVRYITDRVLVMYLGKIAERAPTEELFSNPSHPYTESLLRAVPVPDPHQRGKRKAIEGDVPSPIDPPSGCSFHPRCPAYIGDVCEEREPTAHRVGDGASHTAACHLYDDEIESSYEVAVSYGGDPDADADAAAGEAD